MMTDTVLTAVTETDTTPVVVDDSAADNAVITGEGVNTDSNVSDDPKDKAGDKPTGEPAALPESYEFKMPDGFTVDKAFADTMQPVFKDIGLTQEQVDKLTTAYASNLTSNAETGSAEFENQAKQNISDLKADPDFGGASFDKNVTMAISAIDKFGDDDVKQLLESTGLGNNPSIVKMFNRIGLAISEDKFSNNTDIKNVINHQSFYNKSNMNP